VSVRERAVSVRESAVSVRERAVVVYLYLASYGHKCGFLHVTWHKCGFLHVSIHVCDRQAKTADIKC